MPLHLELRWQAPASVAESIVGRALLASRRALSLHVRFVAGQVASFVTEASADIMSRAAMLSVAQQAAAAAAPGGGAAVLAASDRCLMPVSSPLVHHPNMRHHHGKPWLSGGGPALRPGRTQSTGGGGITRTVLSPNES